MSLDITQQATALIDHIQTRFHEGHRRALPELLCLAEAVEARGIDEGLGDELRAIGNALELHMFKEEMRLFPMMEQGGNTLIGRLIDDLQCEHVEHEDAMNVFRARLAALSGASSVDPALQQLVQAVDDLANELASHMRAEDDELFPLFAVQRSVAPAALKPSLPISTTNP
jgi:regulator of cell morphogenesis and NO signaling